MHNEKQIILYNILKDAEAERDELHHPYVGSEHLFLALLKTKEIATICNSFNLNYECFKKELVRLVGIAKKNNSLNLYTPLLKRVINNAIEESKENDVSSVPHQLLIAILDEGEGIALRIMMNFNIDIDELYQCLKDKKNVNSDRILGIGKNLNKCVSMEEKVIGRDKIIIYIIETLLRKKKNNPLLLGDAGVGKTAIVEELARRINNKLVPLELVGYEIVLLEMGSLVAGTKYRGEFEEKLNRIIHELESNKKYILFIDEIHTMVNAGGAEGAISAGDILKPYLARNSIKCIGATTPMEYKKHFASDKALIRRFEIINVEEPSAEETIDILNQVKSEYEKHHSIKITKENIKQIVVLANEYLPNLHNPDKSLDILDSVCSYIRLKKDTSKRIYILEKDLSNIINDKLKAVQSQDYRLALEYKNEELKIKKKINDLQKTSCFSIKSSDIFHIIGLKSNTLVSSDKTKIINQIKRNLEQELVGQDIVVQEYVAFLNKIAILPKHLKTILLEGSSGIGKTLFVKTIVKSEERKLIIINPLSNFNHFISFIRKYPNAIILVENYDKLTEEMRNGFLNIINDEQIIDENENTVSFRHCFLFIKSSYPSVSMGFDSNRLSVNDLSIDFDLKLQFKPLTKQDIKTILERNKIVLQDNNLDDYCKHGLKSILKKTPV